MVLKFYVKNQTLVHNGHDTVASGSKNYLFAEFRFSKEWAGINKTAVFTSADGSKSYHMLLDKGRCAVPAEVIAEGGFYISVFGGDRITSTQIYIDVSESGIVAGLTPPSPTPDVYNQILEKVQAVNDVVDSCNFNFPDGYIAERIIADKAVTSPKIADNAVRISHLSDEVNGKLHMHTNKTALDKITDEKWNDAYSVYADMNSTWDRLFCRISDCGSVDYYNFPFEAGEFFEAVNDTEADIAELLYNDDVCWRFTQPIEKGKFYVMRILSKPISTIDERADGIIEVIKEEIFTPNLFDKLYNRICNTEIAVNELTKANIMLETIIAEGV